MPQAARNSVSCVTCWMSSPTGSTAGPAASLIWRLPASRTPPLSRKHSEQLLKIVAHEEQLVGLHSQLNQNLDSLRATEQFEESIHSLNAAIHLLTAKAHSRAA